MTHGVFQASWLSDFYCVRCFCLQVYRLQVFLRYQLRPLTDNDFRAHPVIKVYLTLASSLIPTQNDQLPMEGRFSNLPSYFEVISAVHKSLQRGLKQMTCAVTLPLVCHCTT